MTPHPIEEASLRILAERVDLSALTPTVRTVVERVIHASADLDFATSMVVDEAAVAAGVAAVRSGAPVIVDVEMVRAGIADRTAVCLLGETASAPGGFPTRSARAMAAAAVRYPAGAVWVVGCAPTALVEVVELTTAGRLRPALVIGLPVGFVGAAEAKGAARRMAAATGVPAITNIGEKGGSAVAAAVFNALGRLASNR